MTDADAAFDSYLEDWRSLDIDKVLPYYNIPSVLILPIGVIVMGDEAAVRNVVAFRTDQLRAADYARSELQDRETRIHAPNLVAISGPLCDFNSAGVEYDRAGVTYWLLLGDGAWRVCAITPYDQQVARYGS